jgi:exodeoxyribonuclease V alpha subunit
VNLLACLLAQDPACRIALAAPTGKAAARMTEAIRQRAAHLPEALQALLPTEASTVHRLLGVVASAAPGAPRFVHHAGRPLAVDVLVVDEASMLDLALARRLLDAVPPAARIVLLGDKDQLSAVEAGAVFAELSARPGLGAAAREALAPSCGVAPAALQTVGTDGTDASAQGGLLGEHVVWFTRNFRFAETSGIGRLAADIQAARVVESLDGLRQRQDPSVRWIDAAADPAATDAALFDTLAQGYAPYLAAVLQQPADLSAITTAFNAFRALCALREGPRGVQAINQRLSLQARAVLGAPAGEGASPWFHGRPVMVLRNDPLLKLFNGDVGITLFDEAGMPWVHFPTADGSFRRVPALRLPTHQTAFAMTVHKSQGSEFDAVLVLLPTQRSPVLTRELLYTAVTRARSQLTLVGSAEVLAAAMRAPTRRRSGLLARLRELQGVQ